ncbi:YehR family lipoprotein [Listeria costaricensis]|uniref:YehR family lipoprotein n=1 Tax=Listeria costaricensis TaxID=2026604 RepID=UPI000C084542|nr:DUF1307 domain-containing protein [Listeria costaricensis]
MNFYKKSLMLIAVMAFLVLAACGAQEQTKTFTKNANGLESELKYWYKDDKVTKQTTKNKITYATMGVTNKEEAEAILKPASEQYQGLQGVKESIKYEDDYAIEDVEINYENVDFDELKNVPGMLFDENAKKNGVSMEKSEELLKKNGYEEKK